MAGTFSQARLRSTIATWRAIGVRPPKPRARTTSMAAHSSKKQLILESGANLKHERLGPAELRRVQQDLRQHLAPAKPPSLGYIASVLRQAGLRVDYEDRFTDPVIPERYASRLEGAL